MREDIRTANKNTDEQFKKAVALEDKLHMATGQLNDLKIRNEQLAQMVAKAKLLLATLARLDECEDKPTPPTVRGQVLAVDQDNRAEISLGTDDGLREGHMLEVFRGNKYLGRMQVLEVHPHRAVGQDPERIPARRDPQGRRSGDAVEGLNASTIVDWIRRLIRYELISEFTRLKQSRVEVSRVVG